MLLNVLWVEKQGGENENVTKFGLISGPFAPHIVCPPEWLRYYLLFAEIHRLLAWLLAAIHRSFTTLNRKEARHDPTQARNPAVIAQQSTQSD